MLQTGLMLKEGSKWDGNKLETRCLQPWCFPEPTWFSGHSLVQVWCLKTRIQQCHCETRPHAPRDQYLAGCWKGSSEKTFCLLNATSYRIHRMLGNSLCWGSLLAGEAYMPNELAAWQNIFLFLLVPDSSTHLSEISAVTHQGWTCPGSSESQRRTNGGEERSKQFWKTQQILPEGAWSTRKCNIGVPVVIWAANWGPQ